LDPHSGEFAFSSHPASAPLTHAEREQLITQCSDTSGNFFSSFHGEKTLVIYNTSRLTGWKSIALISRDSLMEQYNNTSKTILTLQSVFIIGSVIVVSIFSHVLTRNLLSLNKAVSEFSRGNMNVTVSIRSKDEIGALSEQFNHMVKQIYLLMESTKQTEREKRDAELRALQAEINPHFLYNTLNTIKMLAAVQNVANIQEVSESLSHLLHAHMDRRRLVSVSEEIANIENYITIMQYRYTGKFLYTVLASEEAKSNYMLQMLLQPLVENAILHGIAPAKRQCILLIKIYHENENLKIRIQDNGVGMSMQKQTQLLQSPQSSASIGFSNVLYRMKLYFGKNQKIEIQSEENLFTIVELTLPIIVEGESCSYD
ncbi:MAG: histidine kinase, partial [Ruthenibacterium sp.]